MKTVVSFAFAIAVSVLALITAYAQLSTLAYIFRTGEVSVPDMSGSKSAKRPAGYFGSRLQFKLNCAAVFLLLSGTAGAQVCPQGVGCLDPTFYGGGKYTYAYGIPPSARTVPKAGVMLADGRYLVLSRSEGGGYSTVLARFNADGTNDTTFGPNGDGNIYLEWRVDGSTTGAPGVLALQQIGADTRIVVAGSQALGSNPTALRVERYSFDGLLDPTFGTAGKTLINTSFANAIAVDAGQRIIVGGSGAVVVRLQADGIPDGTFGSGGVVKSKSGVNVNAIAVQASGRIVIAGQISPGASKNQFAVARLNTDGTLDDGTRTDTTRSDSFGSSGKVVPFGNTSSSALRLYIDPSGRIVAGGSLGGFSANDWAVARLMQNGAYDNSFSGDGRLTYDFDGAGDAIHGIAFQPDGKIIIGGEAFHNGADLDFGIVRFHGDGSVDTSFAQSGRVWTDFYGGNDDLMGLMLQEDPGCSCTKLLTFGFVETGGVTYGAAARYAL